MERDLLALHFRPDTDGTGKLSATVQFRGFSGQGGAWFNVSELERFATAIEVFPIPGGQRPSIAGGFWKNVASGELEQEHLAITVYPVGGRGQVGVQVRLSTELCEDVRQESQSAVRVELLTTYQSLGQFANALRSLVRGEVEAAVLEVDELT
jgi:hypothetical protein